MERRRRGATKKRLTRGTQLRIAHDLAVKLGIANVADMLKGMSVHQWRDWQVYMMHAPFGEERADIRAAQLVQTFINMNRDTKEHPQPFTLDDVLIKFGDLSAEVKKPKSEKQTVADMERHITDWIAGSNQVITEERARGQYR